MELEFTLLVLDGRTAAGLASDSTSANLCDGREINATRDTVS